MLISLNNIKVIVSKLPKPIFYALKSAWQTGRKLINRYYFKLLYPEAIVLDIAHVEEGQLNQPVVINYILNDEIDGFYLDIGANHPILNSNTYYFEKKRGYSGIAFDPLEKYADQWKSIRPNTLFLNVAVGSENGTVRFFQHANTDGWADQLSFTEMSTQAVTGEVKSRLVAVLPIAEVHSMPSEITFASIDVEGAEHEVLKGFKQNVRPKLLVVENCFGPVGNKLLRKQIESMGYKLIARISYIDDIYVRIDLLDKIPDLRKLRNSRPDLFI